MGGQLQFVVCTLFHHLKIGIVGSNHTQGMNVCLYCLSLSLFVLYCVKHMPYNGLTPCSIKHIQEL